MTRAFRGRTRLATCLIVTGTVAWTLPVRSEAPPGRYTTTATTVLDRRTSLTWQRDVPSGSYTQPDAVTYCNDLVLAGKSNWRLPTRADLLSIADRSTYDPAIDSTAFPDTPAETYWTSSTFVGAAGFTWVVNFFGGYSNPYGTASTTYRVRCVRS